MKQVLIAAVAALLLPCAAFSASASTSVNFVAATTKETKVKLIETLRFPLLAGAGPLTSGNNLRLRFGAELSPVSVNGTVEAAFTPIAFLQFSAAGSVGSGWNIPLGNGLRMNRRALDSSGNPTGEAELTGGAFDGLVMVFKAGGTFQFDLAAVSPGDWHHLVFQTYQGVAYKALSSAGDDESWLWEADTGENRNGWNYYGSWFLGYQMPLCLNMAGLLVEDDLYLYDTPGRELWGDDLGRWTVGPVFNFTVTKHFQAAVLVQARTMRNFTDATGDEGFYQDRRIAGSDQRRFEFYRAAVNLTWTLD